MKITAVKTILLTGPSTNDPFLVECRRRRSAAFIEVHTDVGVTGLGETYAGYFCPEMVPEIVRFFEPILIGQNVDDINALWRRMYHCGNLWCRVGLGAIVLNGIDAALWDLKGKLAHTPVYELLGGLQHDSLDCYATGGPSNFPPDRLAQKIEYYTSLGFKGLKVGVGWFGKAWIGCSSKQQWVDSEVGKVEFVRSNFGRDLSFMLDAHMGNSPVGSWDLETATAVAKNLEPFNLKFLEEPLNYSDPWGYSELCKKTTVPIAGGECLTTAYEWRVFSDQDAFDIGQPDASFTGGLGEFMSIASMLNTRGRSIATHAWGAGGSLMQNIHCGFAAPNTCILEIAPAFGPLHSEIITDSFVMRDGRVLPPMAPGLGIILTDEVKRKFPFVAGSGEFNDVPGKILLD
jgi:L-alanine-DL-glutamate epimerase-like enolase superfamily enzyme